MTFLQRLKVEPENTDVWLLEFTFTPAQWARDWPLLSTEEKVRAQSFYHWQDQVRFVSSRAALRRLLAERVGVSPDRLRISTTALGKPYLPQNHNIQFNLSHACSFALVAISAKREIGIDIECCNREISGLSHYVLSPLERAQACWSDNRFIDLWVAKESALKALGLGIAEHLQDISILPSIHGAGYHIVHSRPDWKSISVWPIEAPKHYAAALALVHDA